MKAATCLFVAACLSVAVVKGETRGLLQSFYKYDVCRKDFLNIAATGDTKSPACWKFSRTEDPAERYKAFTAEITSRPFSFYGPRDKILKRLEAYAPPSIDLKTHRASLLQHGFEASTVPSTVKEEVLDLIAFLCCLSKQATDVKWTDEQIKRWESLGLDVQAELAKKVFEPPTPTGPPPKKPPKPEEEEAKTTTPPPSPPPTPPQPKAPAPPEVLFGLEEATLTLPSGARASLHFIPAKNIFRVLLPKAVEDCSLEDFREGLAKQKEEIQKKLLQQSKQSELEEARKVDFWELKEIFVPAEINNIIEAARKNEVVGFTVSAGVPEKKEEKAESIPPPSPPPVPARRKKAPRHVSFGLEEATLTLPSGARASLHFEPTKHTFEVMLPKDLEECSIEDFREGLAKQSEEIQKELLQKSKHSELEEARKVNSWNLKEIFVPTEIKDIVEIAKKNGVVGFTVSAGAPEKKEKEAEAIPLPPPVPAPRKAAPPHVLFGLKEAKLTLPSGARASLHFDPTKTTFKVVLPKKVEDCSLEDFREGLAKQREEIQKELLQKSKHSELEEARKVSFWKIKDILVEATLQKIIKRVHKGKTIPFSVSAEAPISEEEKPQVVVPLPPVPPPPKEEAPPSEEAEKPKEIQTPTEEEEAAAPEETKKPPAAFEPPTREHCARYPLDLRVSPRAIQEKTLSHLIDWLNNSSNEKNSFNVGAVCLLHAAHADIYERLHLSFHRSFKPPEVIEGAINASSLIALKLQTAIDVKDIPQHEETATQVISNTRLCIDAVRLMSRLTSQRRADRPQEAVVGVSNLLGLSLNMSFDGVDSLAEHVVKFVLANCSKEKTENKANLYPMSQTVLMTLLLRYLEAVTCQVYVHRNPRYLLALLSLPGKEEIEMFLTFVKLYNDVLSRNQTNDKHPKATIEKAAKKCKEISLSSDLMRLPLTVGDVELQLEREIDIIRKLMEGQR